MTQTHDAVEILDDLFGDSPGYRAAVADEVENLHIASLIYEARIAAGLSQKQLADKINSRQSVISRLEDADYGSQSLTMLHRIAKALGKRLDVKFASIEQDKPIVTVTVAIPQSFVPPAPRKPGRFPQTPAGG